MTPSPSVLKLIVAALCVIGLFVCALMKHYLPDVDLADVRLVLFAGLTATGVWHAATSNGNGPNQSGFALPSMLVLVTIAALGVCALAGCTTVARSYQAAAANEIRQADDNAVSIWKAAACIMPVGAVLRSPDVIEAVNKFCNGAQNQQLGGGQPINITVQLPAPAASGSK